MSFSGGINFRDSASIPFTTETMPSALKKNHPSQALAPVLRCPNSGESGLLNVKGGKDISPSPACNLFPVYFFFSLARQSIRIGLATKIEE